MSAEKSRRTLMIIGGGIMQVPLIRTAKAMGLRTVVTDYNKDAEGLREADIPLVVSTKDIEGTVRVAKELAERDRIDGVMTAGTDASMTVAAVANALGLPGIKFENAEAASNKLKMRQRFREHKVPSPRFFECWTYEDAKANARRLGYPLVIKPSDNMGSRGVRKVRSADELAEAFAFAKSASPSGELVMEEYMEGDELSIDALVYRGEVMVAGIADRIIGHEPYFVELGHILPSNKPKKVLEEAVRVMVKGIRALGIDLGAAKGDIKLTPSGPMIGELAARLSGGFMSAYTYPYATGVDLLKAAIHIALGEAPPPLKPRWRRVAYERAIIPPPGYIQAIRDVDKARRIPGVRNIFLLKKPGDVVAWPRSNVEKTGNIIVVGRTRREAMAVMERALATVKVDVGPAPALSWEEIRRSARERMAGRCHACPVCDGLNCASGVPGMGGAGSGRAFRESHEALQSLKLRFRFLHGVKEADTACDLLGYHLAMPVLCAPMTGVETNMGGGMTEYDYQRCVLAGAKAAGTVGMLGAGASETMYRDSLRALEDQKGWGIAIFKPRHDQEELLAMLREAERRGAVAVGVDIDGAAFPTFKAAGIPVSTKTVAELKTLVSGVRVPFIVKGVLTVEDAEAAAEAGAAAVIVSNHGGRFSDAAPTPWAVLESVAAAVGRRVTVLADGGVRSGADVLRALALGARAVLIGRPVAVAVFGAGIEGVEFYLRTIREELAEAMVLTGVASLARVGPEVLLRAQQTKGGVPDGRHRRRS